MRRRGGRSHRLHRQPQPHRLEDRPQAVESRIALRRERAIELGWVQVRLFGHRLNATEGLNRAAVEKCDWELALDCPRNR